MASILFVNDLVREFPDLWFAKESWTPWLCKAQLIHDTCNVDDWEQNFNQLIKEATNDV